MHGKQRYRRRDEHAGRVAEWMAIFYRALTGHRILARRWRRRAGEIHVVAQRRGLLLFCEMKYRRDAADSGVPTARQRNRICRAAQAFAVRRRPGRALEWRFNLIRVSLPGRASPVPLRHLKDAWRCDG